MSEPTRNNNPDDDRHEIIDSAAIADLKSRLRQLNAINTFLVVVLMALVIVQQQNHFLSQKSLWIIIGSASSLTVICVYMTMRLSKKMVRSVSVYSDRLNDILSIIHDIRGEIYGDLLLEKIADVSMRITSSDGASILLREGNRLMFHIVRGGSGDNLRGKWMSANEGIAGWVLANGAPKFVNKVKNNEMFNPRLDELTGYDTRSLLCVPLKGSSEVLGVIELVNKKNGQYDNRDLELAGYLAEQAAVSIERANFYEDQRNYEMHMTEILIHAIDSILPEGGGHSRRVAKFSSVMARATNIGENRLRRLYFAGLLHDIGSLMEDWGERAVVSHDKHHALGYKILSEINFYKDLAGFILHANDRFDGQNENSVMGHIEGYKPLSGEKIPLESRILAIAETFDIFLHQSEHDGAIAMENLRRHAGTRLDPVLVDLFIENVSPVLSKI